VWRADRPLHLVQVRSDERDRRGGDLVVDPAVVDRERAEARGLVALSNTTGVALIAATVPASMVHTIRWFCFGDRRWASACKSTAREQVALRLASRWR
jgi:hypothetical protein